MFTTAVLCQARYRFTSRVSEDRYRHPPSRNYRLPFIHSSAELLLPSEPTAGVKERSAQSIERNAVRMLAVPAAPPGRLSGAPSAKPAWPFPSKMSSEKEDVWGNPDGVAKCSVGEGFCESSGARDWNVTLAVVYIADVAVGSAASA